MYDLYVIVEILKDHQTSTNLERVFENLSDDIDSSSMIGTICKYISRK